jgi:hydroxyacylglutathione hydrolase
MSVAPERSPEAVSRLTAAIVSVTPFQQNCSLLWDEGSKNGAVIDPGGDLPRIRAAIGEVGMTVE